MPLLEITGLVAGYGGITAVKGIDISVEAGKVVVLLGSNGAGKSTILRAISGIIPARSGSIRFRDKEIANSQPHRVVSLGISQVPEGRGVFHRLTVLENLQLGAFQRKDAEIPIDIERAFVLFPRLRERVSQPAGTLSGGEQQMLAMGRALMARPSLLLLDEPSMGLSPILVDTVFDTIRSINEQGTTILLVEQNAVLALAIADRAYVLESGEITLTGTGAELASNDQVRKAYLGEE